MDEQNKEYNRRYIELQNKGYSREQIIKEIGEGGLWEGWKIFNEKKYSGYGYHGGGRKKMNPAEKKVFKTVSISGTPEEIDSLKELASKQGKTLSRMVIEKFLK